MPYAPCDYCKFVPFNNDDLEDGGHCDRPDGSQGWGCFSCFRRKYNPQKEWDIPRWAIQFVEERSAKECLDRIFNTLFKIATRSSYSEFSITQQSIDYLKAEMEYRAEVVRVVSGIPHDPYMIHVAIPDLARLLQARTKRRFAYPYLHEQTRRQSYHFSWIALSIARAMVEVLGSSLWTKRPNSILWTAEIGLWKLSVCKEVNGSGWRWKATLPERPRYQGASFSGIEPDEDSAKRAAEYKARTTLLG